jgi:hypothetical protein
MTQCPVRGASTAAVTSRVRSPKDSQVDSIRAFTGFGTQEPMRQLTFSTPCLSQYIRPISSP